MKKSTIVIIAAVLVAVVALAVFGLPLFSRLYYGRSQAATLFAWQLKKDAFTTDEAFADYLSEKQAENAQPYTIPSSMDFSVSAKACSTEAMQYYILNEQASPDCLLVYFPGGSYIDQPREVQWAFLDKLAADTNAEIVVPIYPKLPEADATESYAALTQFYTEVIGEQSCGSLFFMGDSAGAGMALSLAMQLRDNGASGPDELVLLCPWVDVTMSNPDIAAYEKKDPALDSVMLAHLGQLWAGDLSTTDPVVSPLYGSFDNLGHITLITSTGELLYPDIMLLDEALTTAGIEHDAIVANGMFHVWPLYIGFSIPESQQTYDEIVSIIG